jgi:molybdopterin/thiamine biosynthesis adenylyltransferase
MAWLRRRGDAPLSDRAERHSPEAGGDLYSRNWAFISRETQDRLAQTTLLAAGTGLGSVIAVLAAQTGFQRFILADGDRVALSNLNRQAFTRADLGRNKAKATARIIHAIAPNAWVKIVSRFLDTVSAAKYIARADLVINTIDLTSSAFLGVNRVARAQGKPVIFPMNLGWGGAVLVFTPQGTSLDEFIAGAEQVTAPAERAADDATLIASRLVARTLENLPGGVPVYLREVLERFLTRTPETWPFDPQLGAAAHITAALSVRAAVALVTGEPLRVAPEVIWADASVQATPDAHSTNMGLAEDARSSSTSAVLATAAPMSTAIDTTTRPNDAGASDQRAAGVNGQSPAAAPRHASLFLDHGFQPCEGRLRLRRAGTGLIILSLRHDTLTTDEKTALGAYRLEQYVLADLYDAEVVRRLGVSEDPAMDNLEPYDVHVVVGREDGQILCYMCMQSALALAGRHAVDRSQDDAPMATPLLRDTDRPLFPCETEYGQTLFSHHPLMGDLAIARVRELTRFVRNQRTKDPLDAIAITEVVAAMVRVLCDPSQQLEAVVSCSSPEARRLLQGLNIPAAYAPAAPIAGDNLNGGRLGGSLLWSERSHAAGRFTPMAIAIADLRDAKEYFGALDRALAAPRDDVRQRLATAREKWRGAVAPSRFIAPDLADAEQTARMAWTAEIV